MANIILERTKTMKLFKGTQKVLVLGSYSVDCFLLGDRSKSIGINTLDGIIDTSEYWNNTDVFSSKDMSFSCPLVKVIQDDSDIVLTINIKDFIQILLREAIQTRDPAIISVLATLAEIGIEKQEKQE